MSEKLKRGTARPRAPSARLDPVKPEPEIKVTVSPVGRDTLDTIASELGLRPKRRPKAARESAPEIVIRQTPAGRETLAAIAEELRDDGRDSLDTLPYDDRVPNAPGAITPSTKPDAPAERRKTSAPPSGSPPKAPKLRRTEIFELLTFVVLRPPPDSLGSEEAKRQFVLERLGQRLPSSAAQAIARVDVTPWTERDSVVLRVWYRL